jgi:hypothetical protein
VVLIGLGSGVLYAITYLLQRSISLHDVSGSLRTDTDHAAIGLLWLIGLYGATTIATFWLYGRLIALCARGGMRDTAARTLAFAFPLVFNIALAIGRPYFSIDVLSYLAQGYQATAGQNPYVHPVKEIINTGFGADLARLGWRPVHGLSPYGPLWTWLEMAVAGLTPDIATQIAMIKVLVIVASLGSAGLVWLILGRVRPGAQMLGTMLYLWNPVVIVEFAGEGHNDSLMIGFLLLSLLWFIRARSGAGLVALGLGAIVKAAAPIVLPAQVVYSWRTRPDRRRLVFELLLGAIVGVGVAALLYAPLWVGKATLAGLRAHSRPSVLASTPGVLFWYLTRSHSEDASARLISLAMGGAFVSYVAIVSLRVTDAKSLVRAGGGIAVAYLVLAPGYWAWYAALPVALLALSPDHTFRWLIVAVSLCSRLAAPIDILRVNGVMGWETEVLSATIVGVWAPVFVFLLRQSWRARLEWRGRYGRRLETTSQA